MIERLKKLSKPIRFGNIGVGAMGKGIFYQSHVTPNVECVALSDINIEKAVKCAEWLGYDYKIVSNDGEMYDSINKGKLAITDKSELIAGCDALDAVCESSNTIEDAAHYSIQNIESGKHLILMNAEVDLAFGHYLKNLSQKHKVYVTSCDGDQHTVLKRMINDIQLWGFEIIIAGNIKGFLDRYSNPTKIIPEADKRSLDYKMATAYTDGSKLNIEMALIANNLGLKTLKPGMSGYNAKDVHEALDMFPLEMIKSQTPGVVDYIIGAEPGGGVFVIGYCEDDYQKYMMNYYKLGNGPFYLFYRPYHLCHLEFVRCLVETVLDGQPLLQPVGKRRTDVFTYAKRDLKAEEIIDGLGGFNVYGMIENSDEDTPRGLPILLSENLKLNRDIRKDERIQLSDVEFDPDSFLFDLYSKSQEAL